MYERLTRLVLRSLSAISFDSVFTNSSEPVSHALVSCGLSCDLQGADKATERVSKVSTAFPIPAGIVNEQPREITSDEKDFSAFRALRLARSDARLVGVRAERKRKAEEEEAAKKKVSRRNPDASRWPVLEDRVVY